MLKLLRWAAYPQRRNWLTWRAFWHGCLREDWTEAQFDAAIAEIYALRKQAGRG